jgi:hypothetical protein
VVAFNDGAWLTAHLVFEGVWLHVRGDELKGLIQVCNAMHQLHLHLYTAPQRNLRRAIELLQSVDGETGIDLERLCVAVARVQAAIPATLETGMPTPVDLQLPPIRMEWRGEQ